MEYKDAAPFPAEPGADPGGGPVAYEPLLEIVTPQPGDSRAAGDCGGVRRMDGLRGREQVVVVQPLVMGDYWVQPQSSTLDRIVGGSVGGVAYSGTRALGRGEVFAVKVVLVPPGTPTEGQRLSRLGDLTPASATALLPPWTGTGTAKTRVVESSDPRWQPGIEGLALSY